MKKYFYFKEEWEVLGYKYVSHYKVTGKSLNWTNKINDKSEYLPNPSSELKKILKDTLIKVTKVSNCEGLI